VDALFETVLLRTPPLPRLVPESVFDAYGWCESRALEWRKPPGPLAGGEAIDGSNPARMAFVFRSPVVDFLPRELASLHVAGLAREAEWALAPYAIDDATDELWARGITPSDVLVLSADRLTALVWGLHDWAHFHNHGPFEQRAQTELQCDAAALVWLAVNEDVLALGLEWRRVHRELVALSAQRFAEEGLAFDPEPLSADRLAALSALAIARSA
jgi:hypothetical protein